RIFPEAPAGCRRLQAATIPTLLGIARPRQRRYGRLELPRGRARFERRWSTDRHAAAARILHRTPKSGTEGWIAPGTQRTGRRWSTIRYFRWAGEISGL